MHTMAALHTPLHDTTVGSSRLFTDRTDIWPTKPSDLHIQTLLVPNAEDAVVNWRPERVFLFWKN